MSKNIICKLCQESAGYVFQAKILKKYEVSYYLCEKCGFLFTEEPYWLEESYTDAINKSDTGIISRNLWLRDITSILILSMFNQKEKFLDYAGGYGLFVRLMRDIGFDFCWEDKYCQNLFARGFEGVNGKYELVTAFECFEHFVEPVQELDKILEKFSDQSGALLLTTEILPNPVPRPEDWWYYGLDHGQHISFFSIQSLQSLAESRGLFFLSNGINLHILSRKKVSKLYFMFLLKVRRLGVFHLVKLLMNSRTWEDFNRLSNLVG